MHEAVVHAACGGEWWEVRPSLSYPGEWSYRRVPGHGFWLSARFARAHGHV